MKNMCHEWTERVQQLGFLEHAELPKTESQPGAGAHIYPKSPLAFGSDFRGRAPAHSCASVPTLEKKVHMSERQATLCTFGKGRCAIECDPSLQSTVHTPMYQVKTLTLLCFAQHSLNFNLKYWRIMIDPFLMYSGMDHVFVKEMAGWPSLKCHHIRLWKTPQTLTGWSELKSRFLL
jgi:hypothetical protein